MPRSRAVRGREQPLDRLQCALADDFYLQAEFARKGECALRVVGENLGDLLRVPRLPLQNRAEPVVQRRSTRLRQRTVCGVVDQKVAESELLAGAVAT